MVPLTGSYLYAVSLIVFPAVDMTNTRSQDSSYVLVDYENVQPKNLKLLRGKPFTVVVFAGANQTKIPTSFVIELNERNEYGKLIQIAGSGKNALDFHIAYHIGKILAATPKAEIHIISRDKGFDPLIRYMRERDKARIRRHVDIAEIPALRIPASKGRDEQVAEVIEKLRLRGNNRPRKTTTLRNTINHLLAEKLDEPEMDAFLNKLKKSKVISITGTKVTYNFRQKRR